MSPPSITALADPDEAARRRALEAYIFRTRWPLLAGLVTLTIMLGATPLWLSLAALGGYLLHNLLRIPLLLRGTLPHLRQTGRTLFALDVAILLVGLWPMLRHGEHPIQVVLLLLLLEAAYRLRMERRVVALVGIMAVTLVFAAYILALGSRYGAHRTDLAIWLGGLLAISVAVVISRSAADRAAADIAPVAPVPVAMPPLAPPAVPPVAPPRNPLTNRQREILRLVAAGLGTRAIADELHLSPETVRTHLQHSSRELGVESRVAAVERARTLGLLD